VDLLVFIIQLCFVEYNETSTNITRYLYSSYSPDRAKDQKPWQVRIMGKRKRWIINPGCQVLLGANFIGL